MPALQVNWDGKPLPQNPGDVTDGEQLRGYGFVGGAVHEIDVYQHLDEFFNSQRQTRTDQPVAVTVRLTDGAEAQLVVKRISTIDVPWNDPVAAEAPYHFYPDWLFEGWVLTPSFDPAQGASGQPRFVLYVDIAGSGEPVGEAYLQIIPDNPDPDGPINVIEL